VIDAESCLVASSLRFPELEKRCDFRTAQAYHEVGAAIRTLCAALASAETSGVPRQRMRELIQEACSAHATSPFVNRLQTWPQGYPGDFLTVEYLMTQKNQAEAGTLGYMIEQYCLETAIAQQHRNKVQYQAKQILHCILHNQNRGKSPKILVLAAGASPDLRYVMDLVAPLDFRVVINDSDPEAIEHSLRELSPIGGKVVAFEGNAIRCADEIREQGPYDLVAAGGLFDYLNSNWASQFISLVMNDWVAPDGEFFFTNIAAGNPYRLWMECVTDWEVIERTEQDLLDLVTNVAPKDARIHVTREPTSLTWLVNVCRGSRLHSHPENTIR
jgi:hypothetical protein